MKITGVKTFVAHPGTGKNLCFVKKVEDGYIQIPTGPGLGIDLNEDALARHPYEPFPARSPRQYFQEGP